MGELLVCDGCGVAASKYMTRTLSCGSAVHSFHLHCLDPPVKSAEDLPEGDWFCKDCVSEGEKPPGAQPEVEGMETASRDIEAYVNVD